MKLRMLLTVAIFLAPTAIGQGYKPEAGFVPDAKTAVKIAEAVLIPVYGEKKIEAERPFNAELKEGEWTVSGTLRCPDGPGGITPSCKGGTATVKIAKFDGRILFMLHYK
ncbi:MAG TPA: NTF2 fold immunity protein [Candidatus Acidoferrum sp.]|jgi:hypothetical protein